MRGRATISPISPRKTGLDRGYPGTPIGSRDSGIAPCAILSDCATPSVFSASSGFFTAFSGLVASCGSAGGDPVIPVFPNYNQRVARGWESKSVEAQQAEAVEDKTKRRAKLTAQDAARAREKENVRLSRQSIRQRLQATHNPRHRELLQSTLAELDGKLSRFEN